MRRACVGGLGEGGEDEDAGREEEQAQTPHTHPAQGVRCTSRRPAPRGAPARAATHAPARPCRRPHPRRRPCAASAPALPPPAARPPRPRQRSSGAPWQPVRPRPRFRPTCPSRRPHSWGCKASR
eukprot:364374-Chlamydomonas_euryale.AAC.17